MQNLLPCRKITVFEGNALTFHAYSVRGHACPMTDSNRRPCPYEGPALPAELMGLRARSFKRNTLVAQGGITKEYRHLRGVRSRRLHNRQARGVRQLQ